MKHALRSIFSVFAIATTTSDAFAQNYPPPTIFECVQIGMVARSCANSPDNKICKMGLEEAHKNPAKALQWIRTCYNSGEHSMPDNTMSLMKQHLRTP